MLNFISMPPIVWQYQAHPHIVRSMMRRNLRAFLWGAFTGSVITFLLTVIVIGSKVSNKLAVVSVGDGGSAAVAIHNSSGMTDKRSVESEKEDDEDWGKKICPSPWIQNREDFFKYVTTISQTCNKPVKVGGAVHKFGMIDGDKWICMDDEYKIGPGNCLVYSFGLNNEYSFEDEMDQKYNCKIMGFDHTSVKENHTRSPNIHVFKLGLSGTDQPQVKRYSTLLEMNGHMDAIIDYLKIDIEGHEIDVLRDILTNTPNLMKNVKQIGMEIHGGHRKWGLWRLFEHLECFGFRIAFSNENLIMKKLLKEGINGNFEIVWTRQHSW